MGKRGPAPLEADLKRLRGTFKASRQAPRTEAEPEPIPPAPRRPYVAIGDKYARDVVSGRIVAGRNVRLLVQQHLNDLERAKTDRAFPYVFEKTHAIAVCQFCERLPLALGDAGLMRLRPVQIFLLMLWFGWRMRSDRSVRRYRFIYVEIARKFGKSTLTAAISLYGLVGEGEHGARIVIAATAGSQTEHIFGTARFMAGGAYLRSLGVRVFKRAIVHEPSNSKIEALNSRAHSLHGANPSMCLIDELHEVPHALFNVLRTSFGARRNPLLLVLTTAGRDITSIAYETRTRAIKALEGVLDDPRLCGAIFTIDEGDRWDDETVWLKSNPQLDDPTPRLDELRQLALEAKHTPSQELSFKQFHLNLWQQISASAWLNVEEIRACADPRLRLEDFFGAEVYVGFDSALKDDSASVAITALRDGVLYAFGKSFLPRESIDRYAQLIPEYRGWTDDGTLEATEGAIVDLAAIRDYVLWIHERFQVMGCVVEMFAAGNLPSDLVRAGVKVEVSPKNARVFTPPALDLEARIRNGLFKYDGNSHRTWMLSNACVERRRDGSLLPVKASEKSPHKIDWTDAVLLSMIPMLAAATLAPPEPFLMVLPMFGGGRRR